MKSRLKWEILKKCGIVTRQKAHNGRVLNVFAICMKIKIFRPLSAPINRLVGGVIMTSLKRIRTAVVTESPLKPQMIVFSRQLSLINRLIRTWQNDSDMIKLLNVLSKRFLNFFIYFF